MKKILVLMDESEHLIIEETDRYYICEDITLRKSNPIIAGTKEVPATKSKSKKGKSEEEYSVPSDEELFGTIPKEVEDEYGEINLTDSEK